MYAQKLSFDYAHTLHTVRIVHNAHSVHRSRVQKGKSCDCINFVGQLIRSLAVALR
jgi:hypothetical protein